MTLIIAICTLLLLAYIFDLTAAKTRIPSVILLILLGYAVRQLANLYPEAAIPNLNPVLPVLGTIGLILIVLEGALELELNRAKLGFIGISAAMALLPILALSFGLGYAFHHWGGVPYKTGLANAIPFAVISSAIAIPSAQNLPSRNREFITYESSLSDIFGVVLFNFITLNDHINPASFGTFAFQMVLILVVTLVAAMGLAFLLSKIRHHVKFLPIILMSLLIYGIAKHYHLPALIFILLFGLFLGNLDELRHFRFIQKLHPEILNREVHRFKELTTEVAFLIRALFFLVFGYLIQTDELMNTATMAWAAGITAAIFLLRWIFLKLFRFPVRPLMFIAPRGLITILLFLSLPATMTADVSNRSLLIQVIVLSALVMMLGLMVDYGAKEDTSPEEVPVPHIT